MAKFNETGANTPEKIIFDTIFAEVSGGVPLKAIDTIVPNGTAIGKDNDGKYIACTVSGEEGAKTVTPAPVGIMLSDDSKGSKGGEIVRCITGGNIRSVNTTIDPEILSKLKNIQSI